MQENFSTDSIIQYSKKLYNKGFFSFFKGSISKRINDDLIFINRQGCMFDSLTQQDIIKVNIKYSLLTDEASSDSLTHFKIYQNIAEAKYIIFAVPTYTNLISFRYDELLPLDHIGKLFLEKINIHNLNDYMNRDKYLPNLIYKLMKEDGKKLLIIKGYGVYIYDTNIINIVKTLDILEESSKIIYMHNCMK